MSWSLPKTNWVATDYFNIQDYNRIARNLEWINGKISGLYGSVNFESMPIVGYADYPFADTLNAVENNLYALNNKTYKLDIGKKKTYYANQPTWTYEDLNRIESAIGQLKDKAEAEIQAIYTLPFRLGNNRGIRP